MKIQSTAMQHEDHFLGQSHHSVLEDVEYCLLSHKTTEASIHPGCESQYKHDNDDAVIHELFNSAQVKQHGIVRLM